MDKTVLLAIIGAIIFGVVLGLIPLLLSALFIRKVGPNQVMVVYGAGGTKVIVGGSHIVLPRFQQVKYFSLELMPFTVELTQEIYLAEQRTSVSVEATVLIKVRTDEVDISLIVEQLQSKNQLTRTELLGALSVNSPQQSVLRAVELFLDKSQSERVELIRIVIEGRLRSLIGQRSFEELMKEPEAITEGMFKTTQGDLSRMGLEMVSFTLQEMHRLVSR